MTGTDILVFAAFAALAVLFVIAFYGEGGY
jgi:hypothetical protein